MKPLNSKIIKILLLPVLVFNAYTCTGQVKDALNELKARQEIYKSWAESVKTGNQAPDFRYQDIRNDTVQLSSLLGKPVVLFIWDGWCPYAETQITAYEKLKNQFRGDNIAFVTIATDVPKEYWEVYVKKNNHKDIQLWSGGNNEPPAFNYLLKDITTWQELDPASVKTREFKKAVDSGITIIPVNYMFVVIDADGKIVDNNIVRISNNRILEEKIYSLLRTANEKYP
ncbi:MAG TPA: redoxin domain-containing protein [Chitinophagales bacterium]|nr:redoxin domain-containing protein [Chitinophagales bacterium]